jgi:hypothetical protein
MGILSINDDGSISFKYGEDYVDTEKEEISRHSNIDEAVLHADAGTTYNRTGLLPSELAAQRGELLVALERPHFEMDYYYDQYPHMAKGYVLDAMENADITIKRCNNGKI